MIDLETILNKTKYRHLIKQDQKLVEYFLNTIPWTSDIDEAIHCVKNKISTIPLCEVCNDGTKLEFKKRSDGTMSYSNGCCLQHARIHTNRHKYGVDNPSQSLNIKNKKKETTLKNYGVEHNSQSTVIKKKKEETVMKNYGVSSPLQNHDIMEKTKQTNIVRYGVPHPLQNHDIMEKTKQTNIVRYLVENPQQNPQIKYKTENTCNVKYGCRNPAGSEIIKNKIKQTNIVRYGVGSPLQNENIRSKIKQTNIVRYGVENPMSSDIVRLKSRQSFINSFFNKKVALLANIVEPMFESVDYVDTNNLYKWRCKKCNNEFNSHLKNGYIPRCFICYPKQIGMSKCENDIFEIIPVMNKIKSDRTVLNGKELDIYLPDFNLAIEFNGIYWHSELNGKDKKYHLDKTLNCEKKGIQLIHIFESEWIEKQNIVKSIIHAKIGLFVKRIFARKCHIKEISSQEKNEFLEENHIQGSDKSAIKLGLFYNDELISIMTFGKSRYTSNYQYEMYRFCSKLNYQIIGGASKLWAYFVKNNNPESVISYADRRYSNGTFYEKIGFKKKHISNPNYFYFKSSPNLLSRIQFQKHKLENKLEVFNQNLTEWENMQLNGYDRIWDCGNFVFEWINH